MGGFIDWKTLKHVLIYKTLINLYRSFLVTQRQHVHAKNLKNTFNYFLYLHGRSLGFIFAPLNKSSKSIYIKIQIYLVLSDVIKCYDNLAKTQITD
jgi:hypothetical protein